MNTNRWYLSDPDSNGLQAVLDSEGCTICPPIHSSIAGEICRDHNTQSLLVIALKTALEIGDQCSRGFLAKFHRDARSALAEAGIQFANFGQSQPQQVTKP